MHHTNIESILFNEGVDSRGKLWLLIRYNYLRPLLVEALIIKTISFQYFGNIPGNGASVSNTAYKNHLVRQH